MQISTTKRYILPFSSQKSRETEAEAAAVYAVAEFSRSRGGGLLSRQPPESITFIAKLGYPLWLFPKNNQALIFDALNDNNYNLPYLGTPSADAFMGSLEKNQRPREAYAAFLVDHGSYFHQPPKENQLQLKGLIATPEFKSEFAIYRKEAAEVTAPLTTMLSPLLEESAVTAAMLELDRLQVSLKIEEEKLSEALRVTKKITSQYITELDYEASAATEEANAKIKAQEEFINPQITKLNREYNHKIKDLAASFDEELERHQKLRAKTQKSLEKCEADIREFESQAKEQSKRGHRIYESRWKDKAKQAEKELSGLKKELKNIEDTAKRLSKQKALDISKLNFDWDAELKWLRQPLVDLEEARETKILALKQESNRLIALEKPIVEGIDKVLKLRETVNAAFDGLGINDSQPHNLIMVYLPFYVVCYEAGLARRYLCIPPSTVSPVDFSAKLKGALGMSKRRDLLAARFKTTEKLITNLEMFARQNSAFEGQLWSLGEKNNLLRNSEFCGDVKGGLVCLRQAGWLSEREHQELINRLL